MKRFIVILAFILFLASQALGATLNVTASWNANTETDMKEYRIYRTDSGLNDLMATVAHPAISTQFQVEVPSNSTGTLQLSLFAVDQADQPSATPATASAPWNVDLPPAPPTGFSIVITVINP